MRALIPAVGQVLDLVDAHEPVLGGVRLLQHVQLEVFVADLRVPYPIVPSRLPCEQNKRVSGYATRGECRPTSGCKWDMSVGFPGNQRKRTIQIRR